MVVGSASSKPITSLHAFYCPEPSETITPSGDQANFRGGCNDYLSGLAIPVGNWTETSIRFASMGVG
jgi:hypothetical protein